MYGPANKITENVISKQNNQRFGHTKLGLSTNTNKTYFRSFKHRRAGFCVLSVMFVL